MQNDGSNVTSAAVDAAKADAAKERDDAHNSANKDQEEFDKQLLTLSVGTLTLLLAFIKDLVKLPSARWSLAFYAACMCLSLCVLCVLGSYQYCIWVNRRISTHFAYKMAGREDEKPYPDIAVKYTVLVNLMSGFFFASGLVLASSFVLWNIHIERKTALENKPAKLTYIPLPPQEERGQFGKVQAPPTSNPVKPATPTAATEREIVVKQQANDGQTPKPVVSPKNMIEGQMPKPVAVEPKRK